MNANNERFSPRLAGIMAVLAVCAALTAACDNTIRGVGSDLEESADAVEDKVD